MKQTPLKRIGKIGKANLKANAILAKRWKELNITRCEIALPGCLGTWLIQNVHRHKRNDYRGSVELLSAYNQVVRGCQRCHDQIEHNKKLTEEIFLKLRGEE